MSHKGNDYWNEPEEWAEEKWGTEIRGRDFRRGWKQIQTEKILKEGRKKVVAYQLKGIEYITDLFKKMKKGG